MRIGLTHTAPMRPLQVLRVLLTTVVAGVTLTGCSPTPQPILGLAVADGQPMAMLYACGPDASVSLYPAEAAVDPDLQWAVSSPYVAGLIEMKLLGAPPPGWEGGQSAATLQSGVRYHLAGSSGVEARIVKFTSADLDRIDAGLVLIPGREDTSLLGRTEFEEQAREACL